LWLFFFSSGHAQEFRGREKKKKIKKKKKLSEPHLDYAINDMEESCYQGNSNQEHSSS
jgi:hypothetical protein